MKIMKEELILEILEIFEKHDYLPYTFVRNIKIKHEYEEMKKQGIASNLAREQLSKKYCRSEKTIESILYRKYNYE